MKKVLVIKQGRESLCDSLSDSYIRGIKHTAQVKTIELLKLKFDAILKISDALKVELEKDLIDAQKKISWADHIVIIYPTWWGNVSGILKGFFDRVLTIGFAYDSNEGKIPRALLKGKTAFVVTTTGAPLISSFIAGNPGLKSIKRNVFGFCGIKTKTKLIGSAGKISKERFEKLDKEFESYGKSLK